MYWLMWLQSLEEKQFQDGLTQRLSKVNENLGTVFISFLFFLHFTFHSISFVVKMLFLPNQLLFLPMGPTMICFLWIEWRPEFHFMANFGLYPSSVNQLLWQRGWEYVTCFRLVGVHTWSSEWRKSQPVSWLLYKVGGWVLNGQYECCEQKEERSMLGLVWKLKKCPQAIWVENSGWVCK